MNSRRPFGGLESDVLTVLGASNDPITAAGVRSVLQESVAYTTVLTVLSRLTEKGLVRREPRGRAHVYEAIREQSQVTALRMRRLLEADDDRAAVLARFVGDLSDDDERLLLEMLNDPERGDRR